MRLRAILFAGAAFAGVAVSAWQLAVAATVRVERASAAAVAEALGAAGQDWASVTPDGLMVTVAGLAPDEASRFRAVAIARQVLDPRRIVDRSEARAADPLAPPPFAVEFLRNDGEVSLIGLAPETGGHDLIRSGLTRAGLGADVTDMLETTTLPAPESFGPSLAYAIDVLASLPRARVTATPDRLRVMAVVDSPEARAALETRLRDGAPSGIALDLDLSSPRPAIAPFRLRFTLSGGTASLDACSAETSEAAAAIRRAAGTPAAGCEIGLGAPTADWASAAAAGIAAVRDLGGGRFTLTDAAAELAAPAGEAAEAVAAAAASLRGALPKGYGLSVPAPPDAAAGSPAPDPEFSATRGDDGKVRLQGPVGDPTSRAAIASYAAAIFGHDRVEDVTVIDPGLPEGWPGRVLAGIDALSAVKEGRVAVTPGGVSVEGSSIRPDAAAVVEAVLAAKAVGQARIAVRFDASSAAAANAAARPAPDLCAEEVGAILASQTIGFAPDSARIDPASQGVIAAIADVLRTCPGAAFEVAGHTDTSGDEAGNVALSASRARAVAAALEDQDLPLIDFVARGYGSGRPRSSNDTPSGRVLNRRIEIVLHDPEAEAPAEPSAAEVSAEVSPKKLSGEDCAAAAADLLGDGGIVFALGSSDIAAESAGLVRDLGAALGNCPGARFEVAGHTDDRGSDAGNQRLSEARAEAVRAALAEAGVEGITLTARGYGETRPVADNASADGRKANRRIEIGVAGPASAAGASAPTAAPAAPAAPAPADPRGNG